jgi:hypothetical protein
MTTPLTASRKPWPDDFPDVVIHTKVATRDSHDGYAAAKGGDANWALALALDLAQGVAPVSAIAALVGQQEALLLPVIADEMMGFNAIPDAMAQILAYNLRSRHGLDVRAASGSVVQTNKVGHTRAPSFQRLVTPAMFGGHVKPDGQ